MGIAVFFDRLGVTFFSLVMTPVFYVLLRALSGNRPLTQHGESLPVVEGGPPSSPTLAAPELSHH